MITLTPKQRRELRAQAHALHPLVIIGQQGLTPQVLHEIDVALRAHALIKVRVFSEDRTERESMLSRIADELEAAPVQHLGKVLILWRPFEEAPAKATPKTAKRKARGRRAPVAKSSSLRGRTPTDRAGDKVQGRSRTPRQTESDSPDARRRRRRTPNATSAPAASTRLRAPDTPHAGTSSPRGKSAPNPRRRRRAS